MELNGTRVNSGYSVLLDCEYKEVLSTCGSSQAPTTLHVPMTSYETCLSNKSKLNGKFRSRPTKEEIRPE